MTQLWDNMDKRDLRGHEEKKKCRVIGNDIKEQYETNRTR